MAIDHFTVAQIGFISGIYAFKWVVLQLDSGIWSDHVGLELPIALDYILNAVGISLVLIDHSFGMWMIVALLTGVGTASFTQSYFLWFVISHIQRGAVQRLVSTVCCEMEDTQSVAFCLDSAQSG